jgi:hypothetical protein
MIRTCHLAAIAAAFLLAGSAVAQTTLEKFETFAGLGSGAVTLGVAALDEHTIANGQGPGLVLDGCTYSCAGELQWNGTGYYGSTSQNILSNTNGRLDLIYDAPVTSMSVDLMAYDGYGDVVVVTVYNGALLPIYTSPPIAIPDSAHVPFAYSAASIGGVSLQSSNYPWSALIDNHEFGRGGPTLSRAGTCPGTVSATVTGATPNGNVALAIALNAGSFTIPGGPCGGTVLGLQQPSLVGIFNANGAGTFTLSGNLPAGFCGRRLQAVDIASCTATNVVQL